MIITIVAFICTAGILIGYAASRTKNRPEIFDWVNVIFFIPLTTCNAVVGASWAAVISAVFGLIAVWSRLTARYKRTEDAEAIE